MPFYAIGNPPSLSNSLIQEILIIYYIQLYFNNICTPSSFKWEWNFHGDHWFPYGTKVAWLIETSSRQTQQGPVQFGAIQPGYAFDIATMTQTNLQSGFQRKVFQMGRSWRLGDGWGTGVELTIIEVLR